MRTNPRLIVIVIVVVIGIQAGFMLNTQMNLGEQLQLDMTLKIRTQSEDMEYRAAYHWGANEIETSTSTSNIRWNSRISTANIRTSDSLSLAVDDVFRDISIENDYFSINQDGKWSMSLRQKLCENVYINLDVNGDNNDVTEIIPSLSVSVLPASLSNALSSLGIDTVDVIVTISVNIVGEIVRQYLQNYYQVVLSYANLAADILDLFIGTLSTN